MRRFNFVVYPSMTPHRPQIKFSEKLFESIRCKNVQIFTWAYYQSDLSSPYHSKISRNVINSVKIDKSWSSAKEIMTMSKYFRFSFSLLSACFKESISDKIGRGLFTWRALKVRWEAGRHHLISSPSIKISEFPRKLCFLG